MITVTLDIETICPQWEPPEDDPARFPPLPEHRPCVISWLTRAKDVFDLHTWTMGDDFIYASEAEALEALGRDLRQAHRVITWNGRGFDMPLLSLRAMANGIDWSFWRGMSHRYANFKQVLVHYDLMDLLGDQGGVRAMPMDGVARVLGLPGKHDISGADVARVWAEEGGPERVARYCEEDVVSAHLIYLHWALSLEGAAQAKTAIVDARRWAADHFGGPWQEVSK
ncbi:MAG: ribonuclease H-like domain-containing protein [Planctomycetes bacterium]|jgi:hypothetical protein|nr:ribonuclease H-like domain-containing protein [Planctomycetota bacterium]